MAHIRGRTVKGGDRSLWSQSHLSTKMPQMGHSRLGRASSKSDLRPLCPDIDQIPHPAEMTRWAQDQTFVAHSYRYSSPLPALKALSNFSASSELDAERFKLLDGMFVGAFAAEMGATERHLAQARD